MAEFDREFLIGRGVPEDAAAEVLAAHEAALSAALADTVSREEAKRQADAAVAEALADTVSREEAKRQADAAVAEALEGVGKLEAERDMLRAIGGEDFADVKPKFREQVYALLERGDGAKSVPEQLEALREGFEEYFLPGEQARRLPRFGGPMRGGMPRGAVGAAEQFRQTWNFGNQ